MSSGAKWTALALLVGACVLSRWCASQDPHAPRWQGVRSYGDCQPDKTPWTLRRLRNEPWQGLVERAREETGVLLRFDCPEELEFRFQWNHDWESIPEEKRAQSVLLAWSQLRAYPPGVLKDAVREIVLVEALSTEAGSGLHGLAGYHTGVAFVHRMGLLRGTVLHHEVGHLLEAVYMSWDERSAWDGLRPFGFFYSHPGDLDGRLDYSQRLPVPTDGWPSKGFINDYATTAFEEDFASLFAWALSCPNELDGIAGRHAVLEEKRELLREFNGRIGLSRE